MRRSLDVAPRATPASYLPPRPAAAVRAAPGAAHAFGESPFVAVRVGPLTPGAAEGPHLAASPFARCAGGARSPLARVAGGAECPLCDAFRPAGARPRHVAGAAGPEASRGAWRAMLG